MYERWSGKSATVQRYGADGRQIVGFALCLCLVGRVRRVGHFQALNWRRARRIVLLCLWIGCTGAEDWLFACCRIRFLQQG